MTEKEIEERLKALPYEVPSDIRPSAISIMMTTMGAGGAEAEEKFWNHLYQLSPKEQGEFFASARTTGEASKTAGCSVIIAVLMLPCFFLAWVLS